MGIARNRAEAALREKVIGAIDAAAGDILGVSAFMFLLPVYAKEGLQVGPVTLGWLWSALGAGMLLASVWLAMGQHGPLHERFRTIGRSLTVGGVAVCILGVLETPLLAAGLILIRSPLTSSYFPSLGSARRSASVHTFFWVAVATK